MEREVYRLGDLELDVGAATVVRAGRELPVGGLSFDLLVALARRAPDVVSLDELVADVWHGDVVSDETVVQRVALLRRSLGDDAREPKYVGSVRGRGYRLLPEARRDSDPPSRPGRIAGKWAAVAALVVAAAVAVVLARRPSAPPPASSPPRTATPSAAELVARADSYLDRHRSRDNDAALDLYGQAHDLAPDEAAPLAGMSLALSQGVTKFHRPGSDREEALTLAEQALGLDPDLARAHYARALALDSLGRTSEAIEGYLRADELDGGVRGLASAAYGYQLQGRLAEALEANLEVYGRLPGAHYVEVQIAATLALLGFESAADVWFERALTLRPDNVFAALTLARFRLASGRPEAAERVAREALESGIRRSELNAVLGDAALVRGDESAAAAGYRRALELSPRDCAAAVRLWILEPDAEWPDDGRPQCFGPPSEILTPETEWIDEYPDDRLSAAVAHAAAGDHAEALRLVRRAVDLGYRDANALLVDPFLAGIRDDPLFVAQIERIRTLVAEERSHVLASDWLPADLLAPA